MKAYVLIKACTGEVQEAAKLIRELKGVIQAHMTFGPYDIVAEVETSDVASLGVITASGIQAIPGVEQAPGPSSRPRKCSSTYRRGPVS